ncbi:MAG: hypothetical protein GY906_16655, partial [bacterium]|nr:hypothetical protein [bacterium]
VRESRRAPDGRLVVAVGQDAKRMLGRTPGDITTLRPLRDGVVADFVVTKKMLQRFIRKVHAKRLFQPSPRILMATPCGSTSIERRALRSHPKITSRYRLHGPQPETPRGRIV